VIAILISQIFNYYWVGQSYPKIMQKWVPFRPTMIYYRMCLYKKNLKVSLKSPINIY